MPKSGLVELNAVIAVSAHRSFRRAAIELGMSPSGLSHAIAALEQRLGVRLFNRTTRSVSLSQAGEQFLARIGPALREISDAMEAVNDFRDTPAGTLRINSSGRAARLALMPLVFDFLVREIRGRTFARVHCAQCHSIDRMTQSPLKIAPPFRTLHQRYPIETLAEALAEGISTGHPSMPEFRLEPDQINDLLSYLKSLE